MAYETEDLKQQAIKAIIEHDLYFVSDVIAMLPCSKQTFYDHKLDQLDDIQKALNRNVVYRKRDKKVKSYNSKGSGYVYIIKCKNTDLYKIGVSKAEPNNRLSNLQSGCPYELVFDSVYYCNHYGLLEREIHKRYSKQRYRGEWFKLNESQLLCVKSELAEQSKKQMGLF